MASYERQVEEMNEQLQHVQEEQIQHRQAHAELEHVEQLFFEMSKNGQRLFNRLQEIWHRDEELGMYFEQCQIEVKRHERTIMHEFEGKNEELHRMKRELYNTEEEISVRRHSLHEEENT